MTALELKGPHSELHLKFLSQLSKRERRAVLRGLLVQLRPWLRHFTKLSIDHSSDGLMRTARAHQGGVRPFRGQGLETLSGQYGQQIRMARLEKGHSQATLARAAGIQRSHLSEIERGLYLPQRRTREALETALLG